MATVRILWILIIVVSNYINYLGGESLETCPSSPNRDCALIYQLYPGHTACLPKNSSVTKSGVSASEKKEIVDLHNQLRGNVEPIAIDMLKMTWDDELAMLAQRYADTCVCNKEGKTGHDTDRYIPGRFTYVGQNLGAGQTSFTAVINAWYKEHIIYNTKFGIANDGDLTYVGHYTQLVWASTNKVGCGYSECGRRRYYVCNYGPGGNEHGFSKPYMDGPKRCSGCLKCTDGLCDCGDLECANDGTLDPKTCKCSCKYADVNSEPDCHINCNAKDSADCGKNDPFMPSKCYYASSACPHMCGFCACKEKTEKSTATTIAVSRLVMLLFVFATHRLSIC